MNPTFEVPVATEHAGRHEVVLAAREGDFFGQRPGVPDAGRTAITDQVEAKGFEVAHEVGSFEIVGHHLGTGGQRGLDPRLACEPAFPRLTSDEPCADHHAGVAGVRAGGDRRDDHVAVSHLEFGIDVIHRSLGPIRDRGDRTVGAFAAVAHPAIDL